MKIIALLMLLATIGCSKETIVVSSCEYVTFLSDKYKLDSSYHKTDTIMQERLLCGRDLQNCRDANDKPAFKPCGLGLMEIHRYKIGNTYTTPKIFK